MAEKESNEQKKSNLMDLFWDFSLLPGPPWEARKNPIYQRGMNYLILIMILIALIALGIKYIVTGHL